MWKRNLFLSLLFIFLPLAFLQGQANEYIGVEEGLSQGLITCSIQDAEGFLWFGSLSGLNRYDGRNFQTFYNGPYDSTSLRNDRIFSIAEVGEYLLIGTEAGGLDAYHKPSGIFSRVALENDNVGIEKMRATNLFVGKNGQCFGSFSEMGDGYFFIQFGLKERKEGGLTLTKAVKLFPDIEFGYSGVAPDNGYLYLDGQKELFRIDLGVAPLTLEKFPHPQKLTSSSFMLTPTGEAWYTNAQTVGLFSDGEWKVWETDFLLHNTIGVINDRHLIITTKKKELLTFDLPLPEDGHLREAQATHREPTELAKLRSPLVDASDVLWFGSSGRGLLKVDPRKKRFTTLLNGQSLRRPVCIDAAGNIAVATSNKSFAFTSVDHPFSAGVPAPPPNVQLFVDAQGREWLFATKLRDWTLYQRTAEKDWTQVVRHTLPETADDIRSSSNLRFDAKGHVWVAVPGALYHYVPGTEAPTRFPFPQGFSASPRVMNLQISDDGTLWIATSLGLLKATPSADSVAFRHYTTEKEYTKGLRNNKLSSLLPDPTNQDILWISSFGGGVSRLNMATETFTHWSRSGGQLSNDYVYGLLADDAGNIWWSSNQGLSRYTPATKTINHFNVNDGLPANEFNQLAYTKDRDGKLYFGCVNGLVVFDPADIVPNPYTPPTRIVSLEINDQALADWTGKKETIQDPAFLTSIELPYDQNNLDIEFVGLEFSAPAKQQFKYYLAGAETTWGQPTGQNQVSYLNLSPGRYTFKVVAANGDGVWHDEPTALSIRIFPPWWQTTLAYVIYWLLGLLLLGGLTYYLLRRQSYRFRLQIEQQETERLQELHRFRASLYQSVTHEFRSPLSVINSVAREWLNRKSSPEDKQEANTVLRSSRRMLNQVDRMLTVATVENNKLPYHARTGDLPAFLTQLVEERQSSFKAAKLALSVTVTPDSYLTGFDPYYLETILGNLLDNALKYSGAGSKVALRFRVADADGKMIFTVSDDGAGIAPDLLPNIFERNVRTDNKAQAGKGYGIGLAYVKELVDRLEGTIAVESALGKGSTFVVRLPIEQPVAAASAILEPPPEIIAINPPITSTVTERLRLLVVEDNEELRQFLQTSLSRDFEVLVANNGEQGCVLAREQVPDLIISDLVMPKKDGLQLVDELKNDEPTSHIPIILLTSKTGLENRLRGLARGANVYLGKPFDLRELRLNIRNLLEQQQRLREQYLSQSTATIINLPQSDDPEQLFLNKVRKVILEHLDDDAFKVPDLARKMSVSRTQLHNKLKALTGISTSLYVRRLRLAEARRMLEDKSLNISEVAYASGFKYVQHFSRYYAEVYGESPGATREAGNQAN